jgi:hypothetical protein
MAFKTVGANAQETPGSADFMVAIGLKWVVGMAASCNGTPVPLPQMEHRSTKSPEQWTIVVGVYRPQEKPINMEQS